MLVLILMFMSITITMILLVILIMILISIFILMYCCIRCSSSPPASIGRSPGASRRLSPVTRALLWYSKV